MTTIRNSIRFGRVKSGVAAFRAQVDGDELGPEVDKLLRRIHRETKISSSIRGKAAALTRD